MPTVNLGQVSAIHRGASPPSNLTMIWFNTSDTKHYAYNSGTGQWKLMGYESFLENIVSGKVTLPAGTSTVSFPTALPSDQYEVIMYDYTGDTGAGVTGTQDANGFEVDAIAGGDVIYHAIMKE